MPITEQPYSFRQEKTVLTECFSSGLKRFVFLFQKSRFSKEKVLLPKDRYGTVIRSSQSIRKQLPGLRL